MNDQVFGLPLAPFSAVPDVNVFVETPQTCAVLHQLTRALLRDDGIAVLTGEVGVGKTIIGKVLADRLSEKLRPLVLSSANFPTRRALYQSVLFSLGKDFVGLSEQEARLLVLESSKEQLETRGNLVLIIDEAHLLTDRLLDELRSLVSNVDDGRLLVQVVLIAHSSIHERLQDPRFLDVRQRIGCFVHLEPMSPAETLDYIRQRLFSAGRDVVDVMDPDALQLISEVSDGYPRCVNTLCDRAIGLAAESQVELVNEEIVRQALSELRQLPLTWHQSSSAATVETSMASTEPAATSETTSEECAAAPASGVIDTAVDLSTDEDWASYEIGAEPTLPGPTVLSHEAAYGRASSGPTSHSGFEETVVIDPYAEFDALLDQGTPVIPENLPVSGRGPETLELTAATPRTDELAADASDRKAAVETPADSGWWEEPVEACWSEISVLESIHELRAGIRKCSNVVADHAESAEPGAGIADAPHEHDDQATARTHVMLDRFAALEVPEYDVVEPESSADVEAVPRDDHQAAVPSNDLNVSAPTEAEAIQVTTSGADEATTRSAPQTELHSETRTVNVADRFSGLFTRLRRRRRAVAQQVDAVR